MEDQAPHASDSETRAEPSQNGPCPPVQSASATVATEAQSHAYSPVRRSGQSHRQGFLPPSPRGVPLPGQYRHLVPGRREREDVVMKSEQEEPSLGSARSVVPRILGLADQPRQEQVMSPTHAELALHEDPGLPPQPQPNESQELVVRNGPQVFDIAPGSPRELSPRDIMDFGHVRGQLSQPAYIQNMIRFVQVTLMTSLDESAGRIQQVLHQCTVREQERAAIQEESLTPRSSQ